MQLSHDRADFEFKTIAVDRHVRFWGHSIELMMSVLGRKVDVPKTLLREDSVQYTEFHNTFALL